MIKLKLCSYTYRLGKTRRKYWYFHLLVATLIHNDLCLFWEVFSQNQIGHLQCEKRTGQGFSLVFVFSFAFKIPKQTTEIFLSYDLKSGTQMPLKRKFSVLF